MLKSLGLKTVASSGTPVRVSSTRIAAQSVMFQAWPGNAGLCYVGLANMVIATGVGVLGVIGKPSTDEVSVPSASFSIPLAPGGINLADLYVDADDSGANILVSYTEQ